MAGITIGAICFGTFSRVIPCSAATIKATKTNSMISGKFTANKSTVLKIILHYKESYKSDASIKKSSYVQNTVAGDYDTVSASRNVTSGYKYTYLCASGYRNGIVLAVASVED